jgi:hypothetical protein
MYVPLVKTTFMGRIYDRGCNSKKLRGFVLDKSYDHAIQVEEKHDEMETELDKGFLGYGKNWF